VSDDRQTKQVQKQPTEIRGSGVMEATQAFANVGLGVGGIAAAVAAVKSGKGGGQPPSSSASSKPGDPPKRASR
jgi:hypothetical protein